MMNAVNKWLKRDDPDWAFDVFFFTLFAGPIVAAVVWSPWWLLLYIPVLLIVGL